eukprot:CAMPEP_0204345878 /NCGR_PEP_ID=MMETSP0469-20131031/26736_1 /ASSEMBLY_ACC=CAM_ASM_000384 /TAXON_ID=2969 /ORGANISM="Oxyrrhis marina" /LENGTH=200 /DNA_ID=CAMNT_0051331393 /DNA_START=8 /DNA_END=610 /DNA_ORIENTATION=-
MSDLAGKTVGLIGFGHIGRMFARMCLGFRMRVIAYDPYVDSEVMGRHGVECVGLDVAMTSDVVSVHAVLSEETRGLLGGRELGLMPPHGVLVNVSRGPIVDEEALVAALVDGRLGGAGLDVYGSEPVTTQGHLMSPLLGMDNVVMWPHLAFWTREARGRLEEEALQRCLEVLQRRPLRVLSKDPRLLLQRGMFGCEVVHE